MLSLLHIENIAVIECADISFHKGFNILTGETGAGKTTTALAVLNMIQKPQGKIIEGSVTLDDIDIFRLPESDREKLTEIFSDIPD